MAERVLQHTATIPAGTTAAAPYTSPAPFDDWEVETIDLEVPPGPAGTMGFYLANNGVPWVPRTPGEWLVWDDHAETIVPTGYPVAAGWAIVGYNLGAYPHAVVVRFHVNPGAGPGDQAQPLPFITFVEHGVKPRDPVTL